MNEQKNDKWLDELISRTINTTKPQFDPEKWQQKYPDEFQTLLSRAARGSSARKPNIWRVIIRSPITRLATAALIILAIGLFIVHHRPVERIEPPQILKVTKSPAELTTFASLTLAYRRGGIELVEELCDRALTLAGPRPAEISIQDLLE